MSQAIDALKHEHDAILVALNILERIAEEAKRDNVAAQDIASFLGFLREFADNCHHGKEEGLLFPAMIAAGLPEKGGPVSVMLAEHEQGRALVAAMTRASEPALDPDAFAKAADAYTAHLRQHIEKENTVLFPMAESMVDPETMDSLYDGFELHEEKVMGHGRHEQLHEMLRELKRRYLG